MDFVSETEYDLYVRPDTCNPRHRLGYLQIFIYICIYYISILKREASLWTCLSFTHSVRQAFRGVTVFLHIIVERLYRIIFSTLVIFRINYILFLSFLFSLNFYSPLSLQPHMLHFSEQYVLLFLESNLISVFFL